MSKNQPTKASETPASEAATKPQLRRNPVLDGSIAVIDFVLAFVFFVSALNTGSLLQYGLALAALGLGIRSTVAVVSFVRNQKRSA